jgi:anaerobic selenocysteine-containing dehydrogenase
MKRVSHLENGESIHSDWDRAVLQAAERLADCIPEDFAMVVSASCTNEDLYAAMKFARETMGGAPIYLSASARNGEGLVSVGRLLSRSQPLDFLDAADLIFCLGLDAKYTQSVVEVQLKRAKQRGAKLLTLNANEHVPGRFADLWIKPDPNDEETAVRELTLDHDDPSQFGEAARARNMIRAAKNPVLVIGPDFLARMPEAVERLQLAMGADLVLLPAEGNLAGALKLGLTSSYPVVMPRVLYLIGSSIPLELPPGTFVIYQNTHMPDLQAGRGPRDGLFLPQAAFTEVGGTLLDQAGRVKHLSAAVPPQGDSLAGWEILSRIAQAMGKGSFEAPSVSAIESEMAAQSVRELAAEVPPSWVAIPGEHDFFGADLSAWVEGLRVLGPFGQKEEQHVPSN